VGIGYYFWNSTAKIKVTLCRTLQKISTYKAEKVKLLTELVITDTSFEFRLANVSS
jgi:hypothetical protein